MRQGPKSALAAPQASIYCTDALSLCGCLAKPSGMRKKGRRLSAYCTITKPPLQGMVTYTGQPLWVRESRAPRKVAAAVWRGSSVRGAFLPWSLRAAFAVAGSTVSEYSV